MSTTDLRVGSSMTEQEYWNQQLVEAEQAMAHVPRDSQSFVRAYDRWSRATAEILNERTQDKKEEELRKILPLTDDAPELDELEIMLEIQRQLEVLDPDGIRRVLTYFISRYLLPLEG